MIIYRISSEPHRNDISGNGAAIYGSRWNSVGTRLLYTSQHISLSILESLVHLRQNYIPASQYLLAIEINYPNEVPEILVRQIKRSWREEVHYTQWIGDQFAKNNELLMLKVPSAVVPEEHNFILNPLHKNFKEVKIVSSELLNLDKRLLMQ